MLCPNNYRGLRDGIFRSKVYEYDKSDHIVSLREFSGEDAKAVTKKYESEYDYIIMLSSLIGIIRRKKMKNYLLKRTLTLIRKRNVTSTTNKVD